MNFYLEINIFHLCKKNLTNISITAKNSSIKNSRFPLQTNIQHIPSFVICGKQKKVQGIEPNKSVVYSKSSSKQNFPSGLSVGGSDTLLRGNSSTRTPMQSTEWTKKNEKEQKMEKHFSQTRIILYENRIYIQNG